jgi:hypothetical protein
MNERSFSDQRIATVQYRRYTNLDTSNPTTTAPAHPVNTGIVNE